MQELRLALFLAFAVCAAGCTGRIFPEPKAQAQVCEVCPSPRPVPASWSSYRVRQGDTLAALARCSGVSLAELAERNSLDDPDALAAGLELRLPPGHRCATAAAVPAATPPVAAAPCPTASTVPAKELARGRGALQQAEELQHAADFEAALERAESCARILAPYVLVAKADATRARCHVVAATAAAGLGRRERAVEEFRRAFAIDPELELPEDETSPRIRELVETARLDSTPAP